MEKKYKPISCDIHDAIEEAITLKKILKLAIQNSHGDTEMIETIIIDVFTKNHEEFVRLNDGQIIRLDKINIQ